MRGEEAILIVDDDADERFLLQAGFRMAAMPQLVRAVSSAEEAMDYLGGYGQFRDRETFPMPNLIITDYEMPGTDGISLTKWIREQHDLLHIPIIILIGSGWANEIEKAYSAGAIFSTFKTSNYQGLVRRIIAAWDRWVTRHQIA